MLKETRLISGKHYRGIKMAPQGGNYVLYDIYLTQQTVEDTAVSFHLSERENVMCVSEYSLIVKL